MWLDIIGLDHRWILEIIYSKYRNFWYLSYTYKVGHRCEKSASYKTQNYNLISNPNLFLILYKAKILVVYIVSYLANLFSNRNLFFYCMFGFSTCKIKATLYKEIKNKYVCHERKNHSVQKAISLTMFILHVGNAIAKLLQIINAIG